MFKLGDRVILETAINAIPAGCYKFLGFDNGLLTFGVGSRIKFSVTSDALPLLKKVFPPAAFTHPNVFVPKYYELLRSLKNMPNDFSKPITFCFLDPSIPAVQMYESSFPFETRQ
jgi:hypothetical protein